METRMPDKANFPALSRQITTLVLAGSPEHAEEAISETLEQFGDLAVVEVLDSLEPQVAALHLSAFDGGKPSLATLLISPRAWTESLAFFAAPWSDDLIEDEPERLAESLFAHIHGVIFSSDDPERCAELIREVLSTDWGITAFAVLFSIIPHETMEIANEIHSHGAHCSGQTTSDHDVIPLALAIAKADMDAWDRVLFEIFPEWHPGENIMHVSHGEDEEEQDAVPGRTTRELLLRLRRQVPGKPASKPPKASGRPSLGEDIFA